MSDSGGWFGDLPPRDAATVTGRAAELGATRGPSASKPTIFHRNRLSMTALAVVAAYVVIATTTRFVVLGIFPVMLSIRAFQRKERLAPLAAVAAAGAVVLAVSVLAHH